MLTRPFLYSLSLVPLALSLSCTPPLGKLGDVAEESSEGEGSGGQSLPPDSERVAVLQIDDGALDVLFVIDNSGSMGTRQAWAAQAISRFFDTAQAAQIDLRVGFTTTDDGNPWCQGTSPEGGQLRMSSCTTRLPEFVFDGAQVISAQEEACLDICGLPSVAALATTTHVDDNASPRPWIEQTADGNNLDGVSASDAALCVSAQGINGCGFESPLESMRKSLERSDSPLDDAYGFMRPWARLAVVFISDEVDCSVDSAWEEIFLPDGNRVFWGDPEAPAPTSAVCWNAGVQCQAESGDLGACNPQNYDVDGNVTDAANAVMRSLTHTIEDLQAVEQSKASYRPIDSESVMVGLVTGVPSGYSSSQDVVYQRGIYSDPDHVGDFGVDPGCVDSAGTALPPVRLRALAELFTVGGQGAITSICDPDFGPVLDSIAATAVPDGVTGPAAACVPGCLADTEPEQEGTQVSCEVIFTGAVEVDGQATRESVRLAACGQAEPSEPCYELRLDDQAGSCVDQGSNAELSLVLPEGTQRRGQLTVEVVCEMDPAGSC